MFAKEIFDWNEQEWDETPYEDNDTIKRVGWPMEYLRNSLDNTKVCQSET
jgi:hypothetical protein